MRDNRKEIEKENWQEAKGVIKNHPNSALATRDYSIPCNSKHVITIVEGYWLWWCSVHHQPEAHCIIDKLELEKEKQAVSHKEIMSTKGG